MKWIVVLILLAACSVAPASLRADLNGDGVVNFADFAILASEWLETDMSNNYLQFNGTDQYVSVPSADALKLGTGSWTISFWGKTAFGEVIYLAKGAYNPYHHYSVYAGHGGVSLLREDIDESSYYGNDSLGGNPDIWNFFCITFDGVAKLYFNGQGKTFTHSMVGNPDTDTTEPLLLGTNVTLLNKYSGSLDSLRLYKGVALTAAQVAQIYNGGRGCKYTSDQQFGATSVVAFEFDEGSGTTTTSIGTLETQLEGTLNGTSPTTMWQAGGTPLLIQKYMFNSKNSKFDVFTQPGE